MFATLNGLPILAGTITLPLSGVWSANVQTSDDGGSHSGRAQIVLASQTFSGTFLRTGADGRGRMRCYIAGGAAGLGMTLGPKSYVGAPLRLPLQDIASETGEKLSPTCDAAITGFHMPAWSRLRDVAGASLQALVDGAAASWRILPDGTLWVGVLRWPASSLKATPVEFEPERHRRTIAALDPVIFPGQLYGGEKVRNVEHSVDGGRLRTTLTLE